MDTRAVWEIALGVIGLLASGAFNFWLVGYKVGKIRGADVEKIKGMSLAVARMDKAQEKAANRDLRIFAAIEELRRRLGNGSKEWFDLTGGE